MDLLINEIAKDDRSDYSYARNIPDYLHCLSDENVNYADLLRVIRIYPLIKSLFIDGLDRYCKMTWDYDSS